MVTVTSQAMLEHHPVYYRTAGVEPSPAGYTVNVTNTGGVTSDVVVLGFISSDHATAPLNKELFGYSREAAVAPGESRLVHFSVPAQVLSLVDEHGDESIVPGEYQIKLLWKYSFMSDV